MFLGRDDYRITLVCSVLLMAVALISSYVVYQVMVKQTQESLGRGLEVTLTEGIRILSFELANSSMASHGAVTRPFLISALQQLSLGSPNSTALQSLKKNIDSLPEAGFSAAVVYDANNKQLLSVGALVNSTDASLTLNNAIDNGKTLIFNPSDGKLYLRIEEFVLNSTGNRVGLLKTERLLNELTSSIC